MGWNIAPCQVQGCALAQGHEGDHRSAAGIEKQERYAWMWRIAIVVGLIGLGVLIATGLWR